MPTAHSTKPSRAAAEVVRLFSTIVEQAVDLAALVGKKELGLNGPIPTRVD